MSSTFRDTAEHTVHTISDLVSDAMQHIEIPHVDLARVAGRRRSLSPIAIAAIVAAVVLVAVVATRAVRGRKQAPVLDEVIAGPSKKGKKTRVAA
jgi:hypothetical protein